MYRQSTARWLLLAALLLPLSTQPALAAAPPEEQVLLDATLWISPPVSPSLCFVLAPGQVTITTRIVREAIEPRPTTLSLHGLMEDPDTNVELRVGTPETVQSTHVRGGRACWSVRVEAPETETMDGVSRGAFTVTVAARLTHRPD